MERSVQSGEWLGLVPDFCASVLGEPGEALTFFLGAGASLSSGAPSTSKVVESVRLKFSGGFKSDEDVYTKLVDIPEADKRLAIVPLFEEVRPYIGYRMLAAVARGRPVTVVNLNWDDCVQRACDALGVP